MSTATTPLLTRGGGLAAPVRIVHLGLGAFSRSHIAWYTAHASDAATWGIAAFTGRHPDAAVQLQAQGGLYTVIERSSTADSFEVIGSIVEAVDGADVSRLRELLAARTTSVLTLTITEAAYATGPDAGHTAVPEQPVTPMGRLTSALAARRDAGSGPLAVVSCDNLPGNGAVARTAVLDLAHRWDPPLAAWIQENVSFVSTSVDRITPRYQPEDTTLVQSSCGYTDAVPVVAEPFHSWVLCGDFPAGRPRWEAAGATFVDAIEPFENRKLWLLNGAHSLLAYTGLLRGCSTVADALADPFCNQAMEDFWAEASLHLSGSELHIPEYLAALRERFGNTRIAHHLAQIAMDGSTKVRLRAVPVLLAERQAGRTGRGAATILAAWAACVGSSMQLQDPHTSALARAVEAEGAAQTAALLGVIGPELAADPRLVAVVHEQRLRIDAGSRDAGGSPTASPAGPATGTR